MQKLIFILAFTTATSMLSAQSGGDPAFAYNKYLVVHENQTYQQVGRLKVLGTPFLLGRNHPGDLYATGETGLNIFLSYNAYNQEVEFTSSANRNKPLVKEAGTVDSFLLKKDSLLTKDMFFVYGSHIGAKDKQFYQRLVKGDRYILYKKYKNNIEVVSTNYADADLRQFELQIEYYYYSKATGELKKIKTNSYGLKKEFSFVQNIDAYAGSDRLRNETEALLTELFTHINN